MPELTGRRSRRRCSDAFTELREHPKRTRSHRRYLVLVVYRTKQDTLKSGGVIRLVELADAPPSSLVSAFSNIPVLFIVMLRHYLLTLIATAHGRQRWRRLCPRFGRVSTW